MTKLTPGERFKNWMDGSKVMVSVIVLLLGTLGYTNKDEIQGFMFTNHNEAITTLTPFQQHMREEIERIDLEEATGRAELAAELEEIKNQLARKDRVNHQSVVKKHEALEAKVNRIEQLVN